jgi:hypothetical protein
MTTARQRSATNPLHHNRAKAVACPKCRAAVGECCWTDVACKFSNVKNVRPHVERVKLWEKRQNV